jgi:hypothetical protein
MTSVTPKQDVAGLDAHSLTQRPELAADCLQILSETRIDWQQVARLLGCSVKTGYRYALRGVLGRSGAVVRLGVAKIGQRLVVSRESVDRFVLALNSSTPPPGPEAALTARRRATQKATAKAEAERLVG